MLALGFAKLSFVFFYRRLFVTIRRTVFDWVTLATIGLVLLWTVGIFFINVFPCGTHISASWGSIKDIQDFCGNGLILSDAYVVSGLVTDALILVLPLPVVSLSIMSIFHHKVLQLTDIDLERADDTWEKADSHRHIDDWCRVGYLISHVQDMGKF